MCNGKTHIVPKRNTVKITPYEDVSAPNNYYSEFSLIYYSLHSGQLRSLADYQIDMYIICREIMVNDGV